MDLALPHLTAGHSVIVSAQLSLGAAYLRQALVARGVEATVIGWGTTVVMGRKSGPGCVQIGGLRPAVPMAVLPTAQTEPALALCRHLFGDRFQPAPGLLAIALGNLNPPVHLANALCNLTRIENGEIWFNYNGITPAVARLIGALDTERRAVAQAFGLSVRSVEDHFRMTFGLAEGLSLAEMAAQIHQKRGGPPAGDAEHPVHHRRCALRDRGNHHPGRCRRGGGAAASGGAGADQCALWCKVRPAE